MNSRAVSSFWHSVMEEQRSSLAEQAGFQVFLTIDQGIEYQQNLQNRDNAVVVIHARSNRLGDLLPHTPEILRVVGSIQRGQLAKVS
jgi:hypothetical protein